MPAWVAVKPIEPPATPLPSEAASAGVTRFSFIGYGDTRSGTPQPGVPGDGEVVHPEHSALVDAMLAKAKELAATPFPVRFVAPVGRRGPARPERRDVERQLHADHRDA